MEARTLPVALPDRPLHRHSPLTHGQAGEVVAGAAAVAVAAHRAAVQVEEIRQPEILPIRTGDHLSLLAHHLVMMSQGPMTLVEEEAQVLPGGSRSWRRSTFLRSHSLRQASIPGAVKWLCR